MNKKKDLPRGTLPVSEDAGSGSANDELAAKIKELELKNDILKQTIEILKKEKGIDLLRLKNREKTMIIDALRDKYSLSQLIGELRKEFCLSELLAFYDVPKSSYLNWVGER